MPGLVQGTKLKRGKDVVALKVRIVGEDPSIVMPAASSSSTLSTV
jgi:hypothetical protein